MTQTNPEYQPPHYTGVDDDIVDDVVVEREIEVGELGGRRSRPALLPLLLGVLILAYNLYLLTRFKPYFFAANLQGAISLSLIFASIIVCLFLIAYAFGIAHLPRVGSPFLATFGAPLIVALLALAATIGSMETSRAATERQTPKSCIELFGQAQNIAKDNPRFRMPDKDRDELRCGINSAIGR